MKNYQEIWNIVGIIQTNTMKNMLSAAYQLN